MSTRWSAAIIALTLALPACASRQSDTGDATPRRTTNRRVITYEELQEGIAQNVSSLYMFIATRRNEWLQPSSAAVVGATRTPPTVWMDTQRIGSTDALRQITLSGVTEVRFLSPSEAQARFGLDNLGGAILVLTR